jgi:hypothetical protein
MPPPPGTAEATFFTLRAEVVQLRDALTELQAAHAALRLEHAAAVTALSDAVALGDALRTRWAITQERLVDLDEAVAQVINATGRR